MRGSSNNPAFIARQFFARDNPPGIRVGRAHGDAFLPALESEDNELDTWLPEEPGIGVHGSRDSRGAGDCLGALCATWSELAGTLGAGLDETLGEGLGGGVCVGLLGAALVVDWAVDCSERY